LKLPFDENLSPALTAKLNDVFPGSRHVRDEGLKASDDDVVWDFAARNGFTIVSKKRKPLSLRSPE
jgi:predicted nuclease of predicted toxin-antitoxin system